MASSITFGLFLTLICLAAGRSLPLIDGDTADTLWNSTGEAMWNSTGEAMWNSSDYDLWNSSDYYVWNSADYYMGNSSDYYMWNSSEETLGNPSEWAALANETELFLAEIDAEQRWALVFTVIISKMVNKDIWEPYVEAFSPAELKKTSRLAYTFDAETKALLNKKPLIDLIAKIVGGEVDKEIRYEIEVIDVATADIVSDFPNWLDTEALEKIDISQVELNTQSVFDAILSNSKVPEQQAKKIHALMSRIKSVSARVERIAMDAAIYTVKLHNYLLETYPDSAPYFLSEKFVSFINQ